jgi:polar amino acid transport system substrate-binding protein
MNSRFLIPLAIISFIIIGSIWFARKPHSNSHTQTTETLIIGTNAEFPPFSFIDQDQIVGFDIDVIKEVAQRIKKNIIFSNMSFEALIPELQVGTIHAIAAGMTPTQERAKRVFFTTPHFTGDPLLAVQKKGAMPITTSEQLLGKTVVVNQGYTADQYVTNLGVSDIVRLSSPLISTGLLAINSGQADLFLAAKSSLQPFLAKQSDAYQISTIENTAESSALAISKKYPQLFSAIQAALSDMIADGTIANLAKKWNL